MNRGNFSRNNESFFTEISQCDEVDSDLSSESRDVVDGIHDYSEFGKIYNFVPEGTETYKNEQNYVALKNYHKENKTLFIDQNFEAENIEMSKIKGKIVWKRPFEITANPEFTIDGATRFDIDQGELGNCWFLAAIANLTMNEKLFSIVVPNNQGFTENYAGIFHFRFWQYGKWVDVVIDDLLPTLNNKLIYLQSSNKREFWPCLLEKAYAKFYGSYKNIEAGQINEALEDICGGLSEFYYAQHPQIYKIMTMSYKRSSFMGCSIVSQEVEGRRSDGLVTLHAYSVTGMQEICIGDNHIKLIRLRNPWGNSTEWNGNWSDNSESWDLIPSQLSQQIRRDRPDGEFWIDVEDFQRCFTFVDICHSNPSAFFYSDGDTKNWNVSMFEGSWVPNVTAGGGLIYTDTFCNNPQYRFTIRGNKSKTGYSLIVGLMQKNRRRMGENELPLEISIFKTNGRPKHLDRAFFESNEPVLHKSEIGVRQLTIRVALPSGRYCIIPSTSDPNVYASYLLRIYSEVDASIVENDDEVGYSDDIFNQSIDIKVNHKLFRRVSRNKAEIGWVGVKEALNNQFGKKRLFCFLKPKISFSKDSCKNIVALWDTNYSGRLDCQEFYQLVKDVAALKAQFKQFDKDNSGKLDGFELRNLLTSCGFIVDRHILVILMLRYGHNGTMSFENFVICAFKLKTMINEIQRRRTIDNGDQINVNRKDWLQSVLYS